MALMIGTAGLPHVIVRFYRAKGVRCAKVRRLCLIFIALLYTTAPAVEPLPDLTLSKPSTIPSTAMWRDGSRVGEHWSDWLGRQERRWPIHHPARHLMANRTLARSDALMVPATC